MGELDSMLVVEYYRCGIKSFIDYGRCLLQLIYQPEINYYTYFLHINYKTLFVCMLLHFGEEKTVILFIIEEVDRANRQAGRQIHRQTAGQYHNLAIILPCSLTTRPLHKFLLLERVVR